MKFISFKTDGGRIKGKISFYCKALEVSRTAFYDCLERSNEPWKYEQLAKEMQKIHDEDKYNDCYGRNRMYQALVQKKASGKINIEIPCEATVRKVMKQIGLVHKPKRKSNGITKADREAMKSDDLLKRDFQAEKPLEKAVTDISELKAKDGKVYVSAVFDCFDLMPHFRSIRFCYVLITVDIFCVLSVKSFIQGTLSKTYSVYKYFVFL